MVYAPKFPSTSLATPLPRQTFNASAPSMASCQQPKSHAHPHTMAIFHSHSCCLSHGHSHRQASRNLSMIYQSDGCDRSFSNQVARAAGLRQGTAEAKSDYDEIITQPVRSLLDNADLTESKIWAAYAMRAIPTWHTFCTVLIGDAAHALPTNGQGSGLAFEDAAVLARLLSETSLSIPKLVARFEALRCPRLAKILAKADKALVVKYRTGPRVWLLKKIVLRAVMWVKSGVLSRKEEAKYDVDEVDLGLKQSGILHEDACIIVV